MGDTFYGIPETEASIKERKRLEEEERKRREEAAAKEAAENPYRRRASWMGL